MVDKKQPEVAEAVPETRLTVEELQLLAKVVYNTSWNGENWQKIVTPLLNKMNAMVQEAQK
jgi:uncharacterized protein with PIN domain